MESKWNDENNPLLNMMNEVDEKIEFINKGGCGIATYILVYMLRRRGIVATVSYYCGMELEDKISNYVNLLNNKEFSKCAISADHFFVTVGDKVSFDSTKFVRSSQVDGSYSLLRLRRAIMKGGWNSLYNKEQNKALYKIINKYIDDVALYLKELKTNG